MEENGSNNSVGYRIEVDDLSFWSLLAIYKTGSKLINDFEEFLKPFNISHGRFSILLTLYRYLDTPLYPSDIAEALEISRPTVAVMLKKLVRDGQVIKMADENDKRKSKLKLSKQGFQLLEKIIPVYNKQIVKFASNLTDDEKKLLMELLAKVNI